MTRSRRLGRGNRRAHHPPLVHRREADIAGSALLEGLGGLAAFGQVGISQRALAGGVGDLAVANLQGACFRRSISGGQLHQQFAGGGGALPHGGHGGGRGAAAGA